MINPKQLFLVLVFCVLCSAGQAQVAIWGSPGGGQQNIPATATNLVDLDLGYFHVLALSGNGTPISWGAAVQNYGQTNVPVAATNVVSVAAGSYHSLALRSNGTVVAWGWNSYGQCNVPIEATNVVAIAAGFGHSLALRNDGTIVGWGDNSDGQVNVPLAATNIVAIAAGYDESMALRSDGKIVAWGATPSVPSTATNVVAMACEGAKLAVRNDGTVVRWGVLDYVWPGPYPVPAEATNIIAAATGYENFLVLRADGYTFHWGANGSGQLNGHPGGTFAAIASSYMSSAGLRQDGLPRLKPLRTNRSAYAGEMMVFPAQAVGEGPLQYRWLRNGVPIGNGNSPSLVLTNAQANQSGTYTLVVSNALGATVSQPIAVTVRPEPMVPAPPRDQALTVGSSVCISGAAFGADYINYYWEKDGVMLNEAASSLCFDPVTFSDAGMYRLTVQNQDGQVQHTFQIAVTPIVAVGSGSFTNIPLSATNIVSIAAGTGFGMALKSNGTVVAWGNLPAAMPSSVTNVTAIAAGDAHCMALRKNGTVICWGSNNFAQLNIPPAATNVVAISAAGNVSLALRADGVPIAWGNTNSQPIPGDVTNLLAVAAGPTRSAGIERDGNVVLWGFNDYALLNPPPSLTNVVGLALGQYHNFGLRDDGVIVPWGSYYNIPASATNMASLASIALGLRQDGTVIPLTYNITPPSFATNAVALAGVGEGYLILLGDGRPRVTVPPATQAALPGSNVRFHCLAAGSGELTYQWQLNGTNLAGATRNTLIVSNAQPNAVGAYTVIVSNALGSASATAMLGIPGAPLRFSGSAAALANGNLVLKLRGPSGRTPIVIQSSSNLSAWLPIYTNYFAIGEMEFNDPSINGRKFYRAKEGTNP